jgi:uncharacterized membrane protein YeaQ/YmgE (transglycosylase-associated protein family)
MSTTRSAALAGIALGSLLGLGEAPAFAEVEERSAYQVAQAAAPETVGERVDQAARTGGHAAERGASFLVSLLAWLVIGLGIGALAKLAMPGPDGGGILSTSLLGIAGALVGGLLASLVGIQSFLGAIVIAVLGAMLLLLVQRRFRSV